MLQVHPHQADFLPSVLYSLAQSKFENLFPFGIYHAQEMVGFAMYGEFSGVCWVTRLLIDKAHQGKGYGKAALMELLGLLRSLPRCREVRTSVARQNALAEYLFQSVGFERVADPLADEIVMRLRD